MGLLEIMVAGTGLALFAAFWVVAVALPAVSGVAFLPSSVFSPWSLA